MTYEEILATARETIAPRCMACPVCNGKACANKIPGPGAKGSGTGAIANYDAWQKIKLNMDTICENKPADTSTTLFGKKMVIPVFAAPVGSVNLHYSDKYNDVLYEKLIVDACAQAGIAAFIGDGLDPEPLKAGIQAVAANEGRGVPTIKPWNMELVAEKLAAAKAADPMAIAMDIDAAGLPFLKNMQPPAGSKSVAELAEIAKEAEKPFIVKGIISVAGAKKALEAGASAIVVSNHGGRVLDHCAATADVLPDIVDAVGDKMTILVDGGIRSGIDIFKALAIGADAVLICRPFVPMIYGAEADGVQVYVKKLQAELEDAMLMCGAHSLDEITRDMITNY